MHKTVVRGPRHRGGGGGHRRASSLPPALALLALTAGCEADALTATARLEVAPEALDFGAVTYGESRTLELVLSNPSPTAPLRIDGLAFEEGSAPAFALEGAPTEVAPEGRVVVAVRYSPDDADADAGAIVIRTNAVDRPVRSIPVRSGRTHPKVATRPDRLDLGGVLSGGEAHATLRVLSVGDAPLHVSRVALRSAGFAGEPCTSDAQCREGRCAEGGGGRTCAPACAAGCPAPLVCRADVQGAQACLPAEGAPPPLSGRGFTVAHPDLPGLAPIPPGASADLAVVYAPGPDDRGGAQLLVETDDADEPVVVVPLLGRPEDLPPIAHAAPLEPPPEPILPGTRIALTGAGSTDPEGTPLTYGWRFLRRPEGSRAAFEASDAVETAFAVDRPGTYVATLEVLDASGQASSNDARVEVTSIAGPAFEVELTWDRPGTDLDLHVVAPGGAPGAVSDCFQDNPTPDWAPAGPDGDPTLTLAPAREVVAASGAPEGAFAILVDVVAASPQGATSATVRIRLSGVEVARYAATLDVGHSGWDVATLAWPAGRISDLDTVR